MGTLHSLIAYPLFRLTICLATGIFLFDTWWPENLSWQYGAAIWLFFAGICGGVFWLSRWRWRWLFGGVAGITFFLWGGISVLHQRETVQYSWDGAPAIYKGIVESVPEVRGKTLRAEVRVEMQQSGLSEVENPSEYMLNGRPENASGSVVVCLLEGTRPIMVEIQALVCDSNFGMARRTAAGTDYNRVNLLMAVLEKRAGIHMSGSDAYVNVAGGIKVSEPALDFIACHRG